MIFGAIHTAAELSLHMRARFNVRRLFQAAKRTQALVFCVPTSPRIPEPLGKHQKYQNRNPYAYATRRVSPPTDWIMFFVPNESHTTTYHSEASAARCQVFFLVHSSYKKGQSSTSNWKLLLVAFHGRSPSWLTLTYCKNTSLVMRAVKSADVSSVCLLGSGGCVSVLMRDEKLKRKYGPVAHVFEPHTPTAQGGGERQQFVSLHRK